MTTDNSLFNETGSTQNQANTQGTPAGTNLEQPNALATLLGGIKNERGEQKYKTVEDALKALSHSQNFIPQLQGQLDQRNDELTQLQAKVAEVDSLQEAVAALTQKLTDTPSQTQGKQFSTDDIAEIVGQQLSQRQAQEKATSNQQIVVNAIQKQFGDKAGEVFYGKAQELGMTQDQINALASTSPQAVLTMFGINGGVSQKQTGNPPTGTVNTAGFTGTAGKSLIGREAHKLELGATHRDTQIHLENSKKMVEELHNNGMSVHDLTDPATFFKHFGN